MAKKSRKVKEEEEAGESKDGNATREGAGTDDAGSDMDSAVAESPRGGGKEKGGRKRKDSVQEEGAGGEKRKSTRGEAKKEGNEEEQLRSPRERRPSSNDAAPEAGGRKRPRVDPPPSGSEDPITPRGKRESPRTKQDTSPHERKSSVTTPRGSRSEHHPAPDSGGKSQPSAEQSKTGKVPPPPQTASSAGGSAGLGGDASGGGGGAGGAVRGLEPPRRVQKNPGFLEEHKERYAARRQAEATGTASVLGKPKRKFLDGNYDTYYNYRNPGAADDPRLEVFEEAWFQGKRALDIGCNSGSVTMEIAERFKPRHIMGFDIDNALIAKARANLLTRACRDPAAKDAKPSDTAATGVGGAGESGGKVARMEVDWSRLPDSDKHPFSFPFNCSFKKEDYCNEAEIDARYDVITCLSVTKWVHFNRGDEGVKLLFSKVHRALKEGGRFILEWQEWGSYKKKKTLTPLFKANCAAIKLHPGRFKEYLLNEVGFKSATVLTPRKGKSEGFQRPLVVFQK